MFGENHYENKAAEERFWQEWNPFVNEHLCRENYQDVMIFLSHLEEVCWSFLFTQTLIWSLLYCAILEEYYRYKIFPYVPNNPLLSPLFCIIFVCIRNNVNTILKCTIKRISNSQLLGRAFSELKFRVFLRNVHPFWEATRFWFDSIYQKVKFYFVLAFRACLCISPFSFLIRWMLSLLFPPN